MHMVPQVRRALILLEGISADESVTLEANVTHTHGMYPESQKGCVVAVNGATNTFQLGGKSYAIDRIESVYGQRGQRTIVYRFHGVNNRVS